MADGRRHATPARFPAAALLPGTVDLIFVPLLLLVVMVMHRPLINADGDVARHLRIGSDILRTGHLPTRDTFSFSRAGEPFLPFEWGSEVLYGAAHRLAGIPGVGVFAGLTIATTATLLVMFLVRLGAEPFLALLAGWVAAANSLIHFIARPHLFTLLAALALWYLLERGTWRSVAFIFPLFALWANLHGGFVYGFVMIAVYTAGSVAEWLLAGRDPEWLTRAKRYGTALGVAVLGSLLNPFGPRLLEHVFGFLGGSTYLREQIAEFWSPNFHTFTGKIFLLTLIGLLGVLLLSRRRLNGPRLFLLGTGIAFALLAQRNISLFAVTAVPAVALHLDADWRSLRSGTFRRVRRAMAARETAAASGLWAAAAAAGVVWLALASGTMGSRRFLPAGFSPDVFPVEAVRQLRARVPSGRVFADLVWGGYLRYAWPEQKVFVDPGTDHYGPEIVRDQLRISRLEPGWRDTLRQWGFDTLLVPADSPLANALSRERGWQIWYCDGTAVVARRTSATPVNSGVVRSSCPEHVLRSAPVT